MLVGAVIAFGLFAGDAALGEKYEPNWESLKKHKEVPEWFRDGKIGIYFHWGLYSVPAYKNEWYPRHAYTKGSDFFKHHVNTYGPHKEFGYHDFIPMFKAEHFDADRWASLFKEAGARWAGPVAEHHDGFAMWDSEVTPWNAADKGPKKDIAGRLETAIKERDMKYVMTFHHARTQWWFPKSDELGNTDPKYRKLYGNMPKKEFFEMWKAKLVECIDKYQPDLMWFDTELDKVPEDKVKSYLAYYFNRADKWGKPVGVTYKHKDLPPEVGILDLERGRMEEKTDYAWLTDTSISPNTWCYIEGIKYKSSNTIIHGIVDRVSKNGQLLFNITPKADGTIPGPVRARLLDMGEWLETNGEAIYGTRPWAVAEEGKVRYTSKGGSVYAICLQWPGDTLKLEELGGEGQEPEISGVSLLGHDRELDWNRNADALTVQVPDEKPCSHAYAFKIAMSGRVAKGMRLDYGDSPREVRASSSLLNYTDEPVETRVSFLVDGQEVNDMKVKLPAGDEKKVNFSHTFPEGTEDVFTVAIDAAKLGRVSDSIAVPSHDLSGTWRFHRGDKMSWKAPDLDDSGWEKVTLPAAWEDHSGYTEDPAFGWYRKTVHVPESWKGKSLSLHLGKIDDVDAAYFNGQKIGSMGEFPPDATSAFEEERRYTVPAEAVRYGEDNVIAIRAYDMRGTGGLYDACSTA